MKLQLVASLSIQYDESAATAPSSPSESTEYYPIYVGISDFNFKDSTREVLNFKKGDQMYIINNKDVDWWYAQLKDVDSERKGYIHRNYVAEYFSNQE